VRIGEDDFGSYVDENIIEDAFTDFYNSNGKKAGVYTMRGNKWTYRAR
jgi:hypothetical protein